MRGTAQSSHWQISAPHAPTHQFASTKPLTKHTLHTYLNARHKTHGIVIYIQQPYSTLSFTFSNHIVLCHSTRPHGSIDRSHVTTAIWWPLGVAVVSVTGMRVRWVSHTWKNTQWNVSLFESSDKCPYWTNPYHMGFRYEASLNFHTYFGQCPNDTYILLHMPLHACPNYPHTGLTTTTAPSGHQMAVVTWDRCIP